MAEPPVPDLSSFGPWKLAMCVECEKEKLVCGPDEGPLKCKQCWFFPKGFVEVREPGVQGTRMRYPSRRR